MHKRLVYKLFHGLRIGLGIFAKRPIDGLVNEKFLTPQVETDIVKQQIYIRFFLVAQLADDACPAQPYVIVNGPLVGYLCFVFGKFEEIRPANPG